MSCYDPNVLSKGQVKMEMIIPPCKLQLEFNLRTHGIGSFFSLPNFEFRNGNVQCEAVSCTSFCIFAWADVFYFLLQAPVGQTAWNNKHMHAL